MPSCMMDFPSLMCSSIGVICSCGVACEGSDLAVPVICRMMVSGAVLGRCTNWAAFQHVVSCRQAGAALSCTLCKCMFTYVTKAYLHV